MDPGGNRPANRGRGRTRRRREGFRAAVFFATWLVLLARAPAPAPPTTPDGAARGGATAPPGSVARQHVVVAHCTEDLAWLDQFRAYRPDVCASVEFHVYSKCGRAVDPRATFPAVAACAAVRVLPNHGTEEYAYLAYLADHYARLPALVSFVQGGGLTVSSRACHDASLERAL